MRSALGELPERTCRVISSLISLVGHGCPICGIFCPDTVTPSYFLSSVYVEITYRKHPIGSGIVIVPTLIMAEYVGSCVGGRTSCCCIAAVESYVEAGAQCERHDQAIVREIDPGCADVRSGAGIV